MKKVDTYFYLFASLVIFVLVPIALTLLILAAEFLFCLISVKCFKKQMPRWFAINMDKCFSKVFCMMHGEGTEEEERECIICQEKFTPKDLEQVSELETEEKNMVHNIVFESGTMFVGEDDFVCRNDMIHIRYSIEGRYLERRHVEEENMSFKCDECGKTFSAKRNLLRHKADRCPAQTFLNPIELEMRRHLVDQGDGFDSCSKLYTVSQDVEKYLECTNAFSTFKLSETFGIPIAGFWPCLFDFRNKANLLEITENVNSKNAYETLHDILFDGLQIYGEKSITFAPHAFVCKNTAVFVISNYRIPAAHQNGEARKNRPKFKVDINRERTEVTIAFSEDFLELLPQLPFQLISQQRQAPITQYDNSQGMDTDDEGENENEIIELSQNFSQASLISRHENEMDVTQEQEITSNKTDEIREQSKNQCQFCKKMIKGTIGTLNRHVEQHCPKRPKQLIVESGRRRKRSKR